MANEIVIVINDFYQNSVGRLLEEITDFVFGKNVIAIYISKNDYSAYDGRVVWGEDSPPEF